MSHFYATMQGQRGEATRCGSAKSGIRTTAASWAGAIRVELFVDAEGRDCYIIYATPWHGRGQAFPIATGYVGEKPT